MDWGEGIELSVSYVIYALSSFICFRCFAVCCLVSYHSPLLPFTVSRLIIAVRGRGVVIVPCLLLSCSSVPFAPYCL